MATRNPFTYRARRKHERPRERYRRGPCDFKETIHDNKIFYVPGTKCMALQRKQLRGRPLLENICVIAPKSLKRPLVYMKYIDKGIGPDKLPPPFPNTFMSGRLEQICDERPCGPGVCDKPCGQSAPCGQPRPCGTCGGGGGPCGNCGDPCCVGCGPVFPDRVPVLIPDDVFIENQGKFTKAPKEILINEDYKTRTVYLEDPWTIELSTCLDLAISIQKVWSYFGRVMMGMVSGLAFVELFKWLGKHETETFYNYFPIFAILSGVLHSMFYGFLAASLVTTFDWIDIGHSDFRHIMDTIKYRKVWLITTMYLVALSLVLGTQNFANFIYRSYLNSKINKIEPLEIDTDKELTGTVDLFCSMSMVKDMILIVAFILSTCSLNDDLTVLHFIAIKKYQVPDFEQYCVEPAYVVQQ